MKLPDHVEEVLQGIAKLPDEWHKAGSVNLLVLRRIAEAVNGKPIRNSVETGSGKTTLLASHLSEHHTVFALNDYDGYDTESVTNAQRSPLLNARAVEFVIGPSQVTLPKHRFDQPLQLAIIDGPHAYPFPDLEYYHLYPHLEPGALLVLDDIQIPTISNLFSFLREEAMFELIDTVDTTAFFRRTNAPTFSPTLDGWWLQNYNRNHLQQHRRSLELLRKLIPAPVKARLLRWFPEIRRL